MQFCLSLRADSGASVGVGVLSFRSDHIGGFFQKNDKFILGYEYIGKLKHHSKGHRLISKDLFDYLNKRLYSNDGTWLDKALIFSNLDYASYNAYISASFGNQYTTHDVKSASCCESTLVLLKGCYEKLTSKFLFNKLFLHFL